MINLIRTWILTWHDFNTSYCLNNIWHLIPHSQYNSNSLFFFQYSLIWNLARNAILRPGVHQATHFSISFKATRKKTSTVSSETASSSYLFNIPRNRPGGAAKPPTKPDENMLMINQFKIRLQWMCQGSNVCQSCFCWILFHHEQMDTMTLVLTLLFFVW